MKNTLKITSLAIAYLILGETEKALEILETAKQLDSSILIHREAELWFMFDRLRGNPRFEAFIESNWFLRFVWGIHVDVPSQVIEVDFLFLKKSSVYGVSRGIIGRQKIFFKKNDTILSRAEHECAD